MSVPGTQLQIALVVFFGTVVVGCSPSTTTPSKPRPARPVVSETTDPATIGPGVKEADTAPTTETTEATTEEKSGGDPWGHLNGRFVYDGNPPKQPLLNVDKDAFCMMNKEKILDNSLVVNPDNKGIANVVITLNLKKRDEPPAAHPSYEESANASVVLDNNVCGFVPHITMLRTSQKLIIKNSDPTGHNTKVDPIVNTAFNQTIAAGSEVEYQLPEREQIPVPVACNIHPWMKAYVLVKDHPYSAVTDADGRFEIKNLPVGEWEFVAWQEKAGYVSEVTVGGQSKTWEKGRFTVKIKSAAQTDLGEVVVAPGLFKD